MLEELHERLAGVAIEPLDFEAFTHRYDRPEFRAIFAGFCIEEVATTYAVQGQGGTVGAAEQIITGP